MTKDLEGLSIIVPTYNEKDNIAFLLYLIKRYLFPLNIDYEIIVIDDSSPDGTAAVVDKLKQLLNLPLKLVKRPGKLGLGSSYIEGIRHSKYPLVLIMDADLSHHPKYIPEMVSKYRKFGYDVVSGTRYARGGGASNWPLSRILISKTLNFVCRVLFRPKFSDLTGSYRLYRKELLNSVIHKIYNKGFLFQIEMALRCDRANAAVGEVPIVFVERIYGSSKFGAFVFNSFHANPFSGLSEVKRSVVGLSRLIWEF
ncbi:dolichol phosphate mannose synthase [Theileria orientalis]|uniref:Dolichol-phosphate mannosyltransferase subunit 1 n=1 Tax=Theileria orientalis TaxID=68886 RepID=A0A976QTL5_THEOR|nr:dolichol phosphate mannose synthase [Theileria orientalis]